MAIITGIALESNKKFRVNFDGGNLSSDGGLLLLKEFYHKLDVNSLLRKHFHTTDSASFRIHKDYQNLLQMLYQIGLSEPFADALPDYRRLFSGRSRRQSEKRSGSERCYRQNCFSLSAHFVPLSQPHG